MKNNLASIRKKQGLTQEQLAELLQTNRVHLSNIERGITGIEPWLDRLSDRLGVPFEEIISEPWQDVIVRGYTNNSGEILFYDKADQTRTIRVPKIQGNNLVAIEIRGSGLWPRYFEAENLIYRKLDHIPRTMLGKECVAKVTDGPLLVKILESSSTASSYDLSSWSGPTMKQVYLDWIGEVLGRF